MLLMFNLPVASVWDEGEYTISPDGAVGGAPRGVDALGRENGDRELGT